MASRPIGGERKGGDLMPRLPAISGREFVRTLESAGINVTVSVDDTRDMKKGTLRGIMRDANMTVEELLDLL